MWSGPRNISTAMMRAWGNRPDTFVCDEPLYAHYLRQTGLDHPVAAEIIARHEADIEKVVAWLTGDVPEGRRIFYQKHMSHHLLPHIDRQWLGRLTHCFLIREPRAVLTSYIRKNTPTSSADLGFPQLWEIFDWVRQRSGATPPVLDARDVLENPRRLLGLLCDALHVEFTNAMLSWPPGLRPTDGVWARHWYTEVEHSTTFRPYAPKLEPVPPELQDFCDESQEYYDRLYAHRLH